MIHAPQSAVTTGTVQQQPTQVAETKPEKKGFSFGDFLDVINPLQHIPGVSAVYRRITGDEISDTAKLAGGTLFGGAIGLAAAGASALVDKMTGRDVGEHVLAFAMGEQKPIVTVQEVVATQNSSQQPSSTQAALPTTENVIPTLSPNTLDAILSSFNTSDPILGAKENDKDDKKAPISQAHMLSAIKAANESYAKRSRALPMGVPVRMTPPPMP